MKTDIMAYTVKHIRRGLTLLSQFVHNQPFSALWKLRYLDIPSDGTCYWLAYGHTMFETYYDKLDPCTCEFKDGKEVKVENYNRRRRSGK